MLSSIRQVVLSAAFACTLFTVPRALGSADLPGGSGGFTEAQVTVVTDWIHELAPACPANVAGTIANHFLDQLQTGHPTEFDLILAPSFRSPEYESLLIRDIAAHLSGPAWSAVKEQLAIRRLRTLIQAGEGPTPSKPDDAPGIYSQIKSGSDLYYRRLLDGKIEDEDLSTLMKKSRRAGEAPEVSAPARPASLSADDIVAEFSRHNQEGSAITKLKAYVTDGMMDTPGTGSLRLIMFKLRPDFFRMVVMQDGLVRSVIAGHGGDYWQQVPGGAPTKLSASSVDEIKRVGAFLDPLFSEDGVTFERLPDGHAGAASFYRIGVHLVDGSSYVTRVEMGTFRELGHEWPNGSVSECADFRQVDGLTIAFYEATTRLNGTQGIFRLNRFSPNPGLSQAFFEAPQGNDQGFFELDRLVAGKSPAAAKEAE
jgi:hypothetical protein